MRIKVFMWGYRKVLALSLLASHGIATAVLLLLLFAFPHVVLYLLDVLAPVTDSIKDALWDLFPDAPRWIRDAGAFLGAAVRWGLTKAGAQKEAVGRLVLLDGFLLLSVIAWTVQAILVIWVNHKVARWFDTRYVIVRRDRLVAAFHHYKSEPRFEEPPKPAPSPNIDRAIQEVINLSKKTRQDSS